MHKNGKVLLSLFDDPDKSPSLILGKRSCLHDLYLIADTALILLIMSLQSDGNKVWS